MNVRTWPRPRATDLPRLLVLGLLGLFASGCYRGNSDVSSAARPVSRQTPSKAARDAERARLSLPAQAPSGSPLSQREGNQRPEPAAVERKPTAPAGIDAESELSADAGRTAGGAESLSAERFALLLPRGPIVVELRITIDGRPFRAVDEQLVDDALAAADRNLDGRATWGEIFADPQRIFGRQHGESFDFSNRKQFMQDHDANRNGLVDRDEARRLVSRAKGSAAFVLVSSLDYRRENLQRSIVRTLLDVNGDGALDGRELAAARERLLVVDANDDQIVAWSELDDSLAGDEQDAILSKGRRMRRMNSPARPKASRESDLAAQRLGPDATPDQGPLTAEEFRRLDRLEPHAILTVNFSNAGASSSRLSLLRVSPELKPVGAQLAPAHRQTVLRLADCRLRIAIDDRAPVKEEAPAMSSMQAAGQNLPAAETGPPRLAPVQAVVANERDVLFSLLDADQDDRLTPRELRQCSATLAGLDADGDGRVALEEIPAALAVWLGRGLPRDTAPPGSGRAKIAAASPAGPAWFVHMDANRDREVSAQEFPGSREKFRALDLDGDGFIVAGEAQAADSAAHNQ